MLQIPSAVLKCSQYISERSKNDENNFAKIDTVPPDLKEEKPQEEHQKPNQTIVKPIPRQGVPLIPLTQDSYQYLRPQLASFYSDWFIRYTHLTRNSFLQKKNNVASTSGTNDTKEEDGKYINKNYFCSMKRQTNYF